MEINFTLPKYLRVFCLIFIYQLAMYTANARSADDFEYEIVPAPLLSQSITFGVISAKTYGDGDFDPGATASSGLEVTYTTSDANVATIVDGSIHVVGAGSCTVYADQSGNGIYDAAPQVSQSLTVNKKSLVAYAVDKTKIYGADNPDLTILYVGFVGSDNAGVIDSEPTLSTPVTNTSSVDEYIIYISNDGSDDNYKFIDLYQGSISVTKATLTATAENKTRIYGEENPVFTVSYSGFVGTDTESDIDALAVANCDAIQSSPVDVYPITVSGGSDNNYSFTYVNGSLDVQTVTSLNSKASDKVNVWPNPTKGIVHVNNIPTNTVFEMYNVSGTMVKRGSIEAGIINFENLSNGIYILKVNEYKQRIIKK